MRHPREWQEPTRAENGIDADGHDPAGDAAIERQDREFRRRTYNDLATNDQAAGEHASRMSIAQIEDRIHQMETTEAKYSVAGIAKPEKPSARIARTHKLTAYRAELAERQATENQQTSQAAARVAASPQCQPPAPAPPQDLPAFTHQQRAPTIKPPLQTLTRCRYILPSGRACRDLAVEGIAIDRPRCAAHSAEAERLKLMRAARDEAPTQAPPAPAPAPPPAPAPAPPPAPADHSGRRPGHSRARYNNDPEDKPNHGELTELDRAVEALVREHTSGSVIEAAWAARARLHPSK